MMRNLLRYSALAALVSVSACDLDVRNPNSPETARVLASPADLENLLASYYKRWHDGLYRTTGSVWGMANVQSFENYSSLANDGQNARAPIPRPPNDNSIGNPVQSNQSRTFFVHSEVGRVATNIMKTLNAPGYSLGGTAAKDLRAKAFGEFLRGISLGYLALLYDSAAVVHEGLAGEEGGVFVHYTVVADSAFAALQRSIDFANQSAAVTGATDGFPITWIPTSTSMSAANFVRLVSSYRARFRANVARTPAERADVSAGGLVDWNAVIADATAGLQADHDNITNSTTGPFKTWISNYHSRGNWHQMTPFIIGMADTSGTYATWIGTPLASRGASGIFVMATPDQRFPQGSTRPIQQADWIVENCEFGSKVCKRYFLNRPNSLDNTSGDSWGISSYDMLRWWSWFKKGDTDSPTNGKIVFFTKAEVDLLAAEGHLRKAGGPDYASALPLVNASRTRGMICTNCPVSGTTPPDSVATGGGLPALTAVASGGPAMTGNACVPKRPTGAGAGGGTVGCGDFLEALKWEKRIETAYTHFAGWFFDHRGWGDLVEGTPLHWAPPWQDLQVRSKPIYSVGVGTTGGKAAGPSTYGW
jgi:hypothetical protein